MLGTRERNDVNLRQERVNDYAPMYSNDYANDYSYRRYDSYNAYSDECRYAEKYENIDFYNDQYQCSANENVFRPIELSDISQEVKPQKKQRARGKVNIGTKGKILVGVYAGLVVMIMAMLLINAIPAVSAQSAVAEPIAREVITNPATSGEVQEVVANSGITKGDGYIYEAQTNWFEDFCNSVSKFFK